MVPPVERCKRLRGATSVVYVRLWGQDLFWALLRMPPDQGYSTFYNIAGRHQGTQHNGGA